MNIKMIIILICIVFSFCGCNNIDRINHGSKATNIETKEDSFKNKLDVDNKKQNMEIISFKYDDYTDFKRNKEEQAILQWDVLYPIFNYSNNKVVEKKVNDLIRENVEKFEKEVLDLNADILKDDFDISTLVYPPYESSCYIRVKRCDNHVISLLIENSIDYGAANLKRPCIGIVIDSETGNKLEFDELSMQYDFFDNVNKYVDQEIKQPYYSEKYSHVNIDINNYIDNKNWYLSKEGLVFHTNKEYLGDYGRESIIISIPYENLQGLNEKYKYDGELLLKKNLDCDVKYDIDGDGIEDYIFVDKDEMKIGINDDEVSNSDLGIDLENYNALNYYIVDLNKDDNYKEIAIEVGKEDFMGNYGKYKINSGGRTYFFSYKPSTKVKPLGYINKMIRDFDVDYSKERLQSYKINKEEKKLSVKDGENIIRKNIDFVTNDMTIEYCDDFNHNDYGIEEDTYSYYCYKEANLAVFMVGVESGNIYQGPSNGQVYFDLIKDGEVVKRYNYKE